MDTLNRLGAFFAGAGMPILISLGITTALLIGCLFKISKRKDERATFVGGILLIASGLLSPMFLPERSTDYDARQDDFMKNTFVVFASIGGNLVAASVLLQTVSGKKGGGVNPGSVSPAPPLIAPATPTTVLPGQSDILQADGALPGRSETVAPPYNDSRTRDCGGLLFGSVFSPAPVPKNQQGEKGRTDDKTD